MELHLARAIKHRSYFHFSLNGDYMSFQDDQREDETRKLFKLKKSEDEGRIGVDAGLVYFADARKISEHSLLCDGEKWQDFCNKYYDKSDNDKKSFVLMCDGIICNTYYGDGEYAVIAETDMNGRIKKIEINFLDAGWSGF